MASARPLAAGSAILLGLGALVAPVAGAQKPSQVGQGGVRGDYFEEDTLPPLGEPGDERRLDARIDFAWAGGAPAGTTLSPDGTFAERWTGYVLLDTPGDWTFTTVSSDGARLWLDGVLVLDAWTLHAVREDKATVRAAAAGWVPFRLEHFNDGGAATIRLDFRAPGRGRMTIPATHLADDLEATGAPRVDAGPDQHFVPTRANGVLHGTASDADGLASTRWIQTDGPPAAIARPDALVTAFVPSAPGLLRFRLVATDWFGDSSSDALVVRVLGEDGPGELGGRLAKWHELELTLRHDAILDESSLPNPFLDHRLQVDFVHPRSGHVVTVPGFFAADGDAAESGATVGDTWRARFRPDRVGRWYWLASFRTGPAVAIRLDPFAGTPASFDGTGGTFEVGPADPRAPGLLAHGRLEYVGESLLRFAETGAPFVKGGADSPENLLGYHEFDGTLDYGGAANSLNWNGAGDGLHHFDPHVADYVDVGVPLWRGGQGAGILGAMSYLASSGVNSVYFLTYNIDGGDGQEVHPWADPNAKRRFDVSKLEQWSRLFDHMTRSGLALHVVTQEVENDQVLDGGLGIGLERKLYYRELVARYSHALGLTWSLGEENENPHRDRVAFSDWLHALDPYDHPITVHSHRFSQNSTLNPLLGTWLEAASIQRNLDDDPAGEVRRFVRQSRNAGRPWVVTYDEQGPASDGVLPDALDYDHDEPRKLGLWPVLIAGGAGVEWYFGYNWDHDDLDCEDQRSREHMWELTRHALDFFRTFVHPDRMSAANQLTTTPGVTVLAEKGRAYALYVPDATAVDLDLGTRTRTFLVEWYDPQSGGAPRPGDVTEVAGPGLVSIGSPPGPEDWVAWVHRKDGDAPTVDSVTIQPSRFLGNEPLLIQVRVTDLDAPLDVSEVWVSVTSPGGQPIATLRAHHVGGGLHALYVPALPPLEPGTWRLDVEARDRAGKLGTGSATFEAGRSPGPRAVLAR